MPEPFNLPVLVLDQYDGAVLARYPSVERAREDGWPTHHLYAGSTITDTSTVPEAKRDTLTSLIARAWDRRTHRGYVLALVAAPDDGETVLMEDAPIPKGVSARVSEALIADLWWLRAPVESTSNTPFPHAYDKRRAADSRGAALRARQANSLGALLSTEKKTRTP